MNQTRLPGTQRGVSCQSGRGGEERFSGGNLHGRRRDQGELRWTGALRCSGGEGGAGDVPAPSISYRLPYLDPIQFWSLFKEVEKLLLEHSRDSKQGRSVTTLM